MSSSSSSSSSSKILLLFSSSLYLVFIFHGAGAYQNYTVGDSLGWFDKLKSPEVNYRKWAAGKNFSLGDFLIFNTDKNHSVVQTYNATTYKRCDYNDADTDDTTEWSAGDPTFDASPVTVPVPLLRVGRTFFFSGDYDGEQCLHGQRFAISVTRGQGLPPSLAASPESPPPSSAGGSEDMPDTVVPSNLNSPPDSNVKDTSEAGRQLAADGLFAVAAAACLAGLGILLG